MISWAIGGRASEFGRVKLPLPTARQRLEENKDEGKLMSRRVNRTSKLIAALGVFSLMMGLSIPKVSAEVITFSDAQYSGRYGCVVSSDHDFFTAVVKYNPDGAGGYLVGIMIASLNNFALYNTAAPAGQFCTYFLDTAASAYSIDSTGAGFETLSWLPSVTNNGACLPTVAWTDETAIVLRNLTEGLGRNTISSDFTSNNLLDEDLSGHGTCLK
jgi:hypothetical protein